MSFSGFWCFYRFKIHFYTLLHFDVDVIWNHIGTLTFWLLDIWTFTFQWIFWKKLTLLFLYFEVRSDLLLFVEITGVYLEWAWTIVLVKIKKENKTFLSSRIRSLARASRIGDCYFDSGLSVCSILFYLIGQF